MLRYRLLLGTLFVALLAGWCWLDATQVMGLPPGGWLFPLALLLSALASGEMLWLLDARGIRPRKLVIYVGNLAIVAANAIPWIEDRLFIASAPAMKIGWLGWPLCAFALATIAVFIVEIFRYREPGHSIANVAASLLCFVYVGLLITFLIQLRLFGTNIQGLVALVSLIAVVKMGDTGAYTLGRIFGRHKMTPFLSPGKTWEGAAGAMLFSVLGAGAVFAIWVPRIESYPVQPEGLAVWRWVLYGLIVGTAGLFGDLAESLIKRDAGRKDSSAWMPGFGGVLDILDSILFAAPVAYACWLLGLVH